MGFKALCIGRTNITIQEGTVSRKKGKILRMLCCRNAKEANMSLCHFTLCPLFYVTLVYIIFLWNATIVLFLQERGLISTLLIVVFIEFTTRFHEKGKKKRFSPESVFLSVC